MKAISVREHLRGVVGGMLDELRLVRLHGDRAALCLQTVLSVVLAVAVADLLDLRDRWWVALSAYVVFRADLPVMLRRCLERMVGTLAGAAAGVALAVFLLPHAGLIVPTLAVIAGIGIYNMIGSPRAYSWVLGTVTALMVLGEAAHAPSLPALALDRIIDVATGVGSTLAVATIYQGLARLRRRTLEKPGQPAHAGAPTLAPASGLRRLKAWQALDGAAAVALLAGIDRLHTLPSLSQAMVSIVAVLLVPLPALSQGTATMEVQQRMLNRVLGCFCAALIAAPLLPVIGHVPALCMLVLAAGVWLAAHIQSGSARVSYIGTQFGVGFIMVFVQDHGWSPDASAALRRLLGIVLALVGLSAVIAVTSWLKGQRQIGHAPNG